MCTRWGLRPASRAAVDVLGCWFDAFSNYGGYPQLLACVGHRSCQLYMDPAWWANADDNYCYWCPDCQRSLRVNYR